MDQLQDSILQFLHHRTFLNMSFKEIHDVHWPHIVSCFDLGMGCMDYNLICPPHVLSIFCDAFHNAWTSIGGLNPSIIDLPSSACVHKSIDPNGCQTFAMCSHQSNKDRSCDVLTPIKQRQIMRCRCLFIHCLWWINIVNIPKVWEQLHTFLSTTLSTPFIGKSTSSFAI